MYRSEQLFYIFFNRAYTITQTRVIYAHSATDIEEQPIFNLTN